MRYTAVALDFDGTIAHDSAVPEHVIDGLKRLKKTGRKVLLVTGRELPELLDIFKPIEIFDRVVAENGALLYRPHNGERVELGERRRRSCSSCCARAACRFPWAPPSSRRWSRTRRWCSRRSASWAWSAP
jgi:predicted mannosyl-3-phosphoglycerate phosphatase (HAD superfamily)